MKTILKLLMGFLVLSVLVAGGATYWFMGVARDLYAGAKDTALSAASTSLQAFEKDRDLVGGSPLFSMPSGGNADAGPRINQRLRWSTSTTESIPLELKSQLRAPNWMEAKVDVSSIETSWLSELHGFDHWDIDRNVPTDPFTELATVTERKVPLYADLTIWGRAHLLKGKAAENLSQARRDVKQLARLLLTHDNHAASLEAINLLRADARAAAWAPDPDLEALTPELLDAAKRYFYTLQALGNYLLPPETRERLMANSPNPCIGVNEAIAHSFLSLKYLPQEMTEHKKQLDRWVLETEDRCRDGYWRTLWKTKQVPQLYTERSFAKSVVSSSESSWKFTYGDLYWFPSLQAIFVRSQIMLHSFDAFGMYRNLEQAK
jgi:hypothetical protein